MKRLVLMGAPGVGKGTVADIVSKRLNVPHISTGEMFRMEILRGSELGKSIAELIDKGNFVPDDITVSVVFRRLSQDDCSEGYILDGFPRDINQALAFENRTEEEVKVFDKVILLTLDEDTIIKRLEGRRHCQDCGISYNVNFFPPQQKGKCDLCGEELLRRKDDVPKVIKSRLLAYHKLTEPLIDYYEEKKLLIRVDNSGDFRNTADEICSKICRE